MSKQFLYFDFEGPRAGPIRLALDIGGVEYEDKRFPGTEWPNHKPNCIFGSVPVFTIDGKQYTQSNALLKYAGRLANIYPSDPIEALKQDEVLDVVEEIITSLIAPTMRENDADKKLAMRKTAAEEGLPKFFAGLEKVLERNGANPFVNGDSLNIADIKLAMSLSWFRSGQLDGIPKDILDKYPRLIKLCDAFDADSRVKAWTEKTKKA